MSSCTGCTRRALLGGIGLALVGCKINLDEAPELPADAFVAPPDSNEPPVEGCESGTYCIDLTRPSAAPLTTVGGAMKIATELGNLLVIRASQSEFVVTSGTCTHRNCGVGWTGAIIRCPCHGSEFRLDGSVQKGPATRALETYMAVFDMTTNIVTITLA